MFDDEKLSEKERKKRKRIAILAIIAAAVIVLWFVLTLQARRAGYAKYM